MVASSEGTTICPLAGTFAIVRAKFSWGSTPSSPTIWTVTVFVVSPALKVRLPLGRSPPRKSLALAGAAPLPATL